MSAADIMEVVAEVFEVDLTRVYSQSRRADLVDARHAGMSLCRIFLKMSLKEIGAHFNRKNHSTVIHAIKHVENLIDVDAIYKGRVEYSRWILAGKEWDEIMNNEKLTHHV